MTAATANKFDWLFLMCYNTFTNRVGSETQLFQHPSISGVEVVNDRAVTQYTDNGVDPQRVVLGTSGEVLRQNVSAGAKYGDPASGSTTGSGSGPRVNVIFDQAQLDPISKSSFCIDGTTNYSFVTAASTLELVKLAQQHGLGGVGFYSTFASNSGTGATSVNKPLDAYQNVLAPLIGSGSPPDSVHPTVALTTLAPGDTVSSQILLTASASDNNGVQRVEFLVDGAVVGTDQGAPFEYLWTPSGAPGNRTVAARAYDYSGNATTSAGVTVFVAPPPPPVAKPWIYQDTLLTPWRDTSWNSTNLYRNLEQVYSGAYSVKATQTAWGALSVRSGPTGAPIDVDPAQYSRFEFAVYNTMPGLVLNVFCYNDNGDPFPDVLQNTVPANQWTVISVPMSQLNPNGYTIHRVNVQNYTRLSPVYYVDDMHFVEKVTDVGPGGQPQTYALQQNYPNPFNPTTRIVYSIGATSRISLKVFNILGEEIATLVGGVQTAGTQSVVWNAVDRSGAELPSGLYYARLEASNIDDPSKVFTSMKKMVLLK